MKILRSIATRHPYAMAIVLFIAVITFVKLGAEKIATDYGLVGGLIAIAAIVGIAALMDRR